MIPSVYINLEDDVAKVAARLKKEKALSLVLVCPKRCQLFSDSINLRLLKKQVDLLKKEVFILTMDERGQLYAKEAGFGLKFLPKGKPQAGMSDILVHKPPAGQEEEPESKIAEKVKSVTSFVSGLVSKKPEMPEEAPGISAHTVFDDPGLGKSLSQSAAQNRIKALKNSVQKPKVKVNLDSFPTEQNSVNSAPRKAKALHTAFLSVGLGLSLLIVLGLVFVVLPSATVAVYPKTEPITRDFEVNVDTAVTEADAAKLFLPAVKVDEAVSHQVKFKSQGKKDVGNKALGTVRIYNFTGQILNLKAETTSFTAGSKTYYLTGDAMQIKPTKYKNAQTKEIDESSLSPGFEVISASGGEDSNLPAGVRLEVSNQVFGSRPQILYAKAETPISGATTRFLSVVSDSDISGAQAELAKQAIKLLEDKLTGQGLSLVENAYRAELIEFVPSAKVGSESPNFEASIKLKIIGLAFSTESLKKLVTERIGQTFSETRYLRTNSDFNLTYKVRSAEPDFSKAVFSVHFEGKVVSSLNLDALPKQLLGKNRQEAEEILQSMSSIEKAEITLTPSWQTNFPWFASKIKTNLVE